jgi:hypothetical protein
LEATTTSRDLDYGGLDPIGIEHGPHVQPLQEPSTRDVLG